MNKHRLICLAALCSLLLGATVFSQLKIDLKTPLNDKEKLKFAKAGLGAYLRQAEWAKVVNIGEDYSVWLKNLRRRFRGNLLEFEIDMEIRTIADIDEGDLVRSRHVADTVDLEEFGHLKTFESREMYDLVEKQVTKHEKYKPLPLVLGTAAGVPIAGPVIEQALKYLGVELETKCTPEQAAMAMTLGAILILNLKEMIDELPPKKN